MGSAEELWGRGAKEEDLQECIDREAGGNLGIADRPNVPRLLKKGEIVRWDASGRRTWKSGEKCHKRRSGGRYVTWWRLTKERRRLRKEQERHQGGRR